MSAPSKRVGWWKGVGRGEVILFVITVALVAGAIAWRARAGHTLLFVAAFVAVALSITFIALDMRRVVIEGACPVCGAVARRSFQQAGTRFAVPCGQCIAYVRLAGDDIVEEPLEETDNVDYVVPSTRYVSTAKRDGHGAFQFRMPPLCAACGSAEATKRRKIANWNAAKTDFSALGVAISVVADVADVPSFSAHDYGAMGTRSQDRDRPIPSKTDALDHALEAVEVPVCERDVKGGLDPLRYDSGALKFRSYRYYKEFLRLNKIDGATESR